MNIYFIFLLMIFTHIVDDYYMQGWLASAKQKSWWIENAPNPMYKNDYKMVLFMHSFSWAFMIMLPLAWFQQFNITPSFIVLFVINLVCHACVDSLKANWKYINLIQDQLIHLLQICITWIILISL